MATRKATLAELGFTTEYMGKIVHPDLRYYHYTNPTGLIGISSSQTLWGGRIYDLNDSAEQRDIYRYFDDILQGFFAGAPWTPGARMELAALQERSTQMQSDPTLLPPIYTVSLTTEPDSLEQWRAYCPRSGGVALGFKGSDLLALCEKQGFILAPCVYTSYNDAELLIHRVFDHCDDKIWRKKYRHTTRPLPSALLEAHADVYADEVFKYLTLIAPIFKHKTFARESEWRLISKPVTATKKLIPMASATGLKLFLPFKLSVAQTKVESVVCTIGPNVDPIGMEAAVKVVLDNHFQNVTINLTETPYR